MIFTQLGNRQADISSGVTCVQPAYPGLIYAPGSPLEATLRLASAAARQDCPIFLRGESGSGKEVVAGFIHRQGKRARGPFIAVNCGALPPNLVESELFGHRKGAFTGAISDTLGKFRQADTGTLFLDEIGDMPLEVQARLLRVLQEKRVCPVGEAREFPVDFRVLCATHRDLRDEVKRGRFREDLFYRLNVLEIKVPPLRERPGDIPLLLRHFLSTLLARSEIDEACAAFPRSMLALPYLGNVRELRNVVERFCVLREMGGGWIDAVPEMKPEMKPEEGAVIAISRVRAVSGRIRNSRHSDSDIVLALEACRHHRTLTSNFLGMSRRALQYRLAKMGRNISGSIAT